MNYSFDNKVALVTGAASGIGLATARAFAESGATVVLADINAEAVNKAAQDLVANGFQAEAVICNVANLDDIEAMVKHIVSTYGHLDIAFNNAGIQNVLAETADATAEDFDRVMSVNLRGVWGCMKYELIQMRQQGNGVIVNCSSLGGILGGAERANYHAAKHGVLGLTKSAALEYATRNIRINTVCPGLIRTPMSEKMAASGQKEVLDAMVKTVPMQRQGRPEEIADAVLWLASDCSSFVTGQSISVDGGLTMR
ncbi:SDR family NAD(P)-dependent oxidoreductase [Snodgrassella sp. B3837]|uniref:SDR family NAD(P)-dependent oxidoreductase n=1 Tax=Snodgrassella sp. B3837 TaxID=2818040 RepID=UPI002269F295|nr:SDR family NAD(P)-dependent oxidoreductase [Snodgrassella sp. B3837]MCX8753752.1 SDR family oxidoreductase [Snodgrassella sp. B3837]